MATAAPLSATLTNFLSLPQVLAVDYIQQGQAIDSMEKITVTNGDTQPSQYGFIQLPSNARLASLDLMWQAAGAATTFKLGVAKLSGTVAAPVFTLPQAASDAIFASAVTFSAAQTSFLDLLSQASASGANLNKRLWEAVGTFTADPVQTWTLILTLTGANAGATSIVWARIQYLV